MGRTWLEVIDERPELGRIGKTGRRLVEQAAKEAVRKKIRTASSLNRQNTTSDIMNASWGTGSAAFGENIQKAAADAANRKRKEIFDLRQPVFPDENGVKPDIGEMGIENIARKDNDFESYVSKGKSLYDIHHTGLRGLTQREADTYSYLLGKSGKNRANRYLSDIQREVNARKAEKQNAELEKLWESNKGDAVMRNIVSAPFAATSYLATAGQYVKNLVTGVDEEIDLNAPAHGAADMMQRTQAAITKDMNGIEKFFTNAGLNIAQNLVTRGMTKSNPMLTGTVMGLSAAGQKSFDNAQKGVSLGKNFADSSVVGAFEAAAEGMSTKGLNSLVTSTPTNFAWGLAKQGLLEGAEETATHYGTVAADNIILGEQSDYNRYVKWLVDSGMDKAEAKRKANKEFYVNQAALSAAGGMLSGTVMGGIAKLTALPISGWNGRDANAKSAVRYSTDESNVSYDEYSKIDVDRTFEKNITKTVEKDTKSGYNYKKKDLFQSYTESVQIGELSPLADFTLYESVSKQVDTEIVGITTRNGIVISGKSKHCIARIIGSVEERRNGVSVSDILEALTNNNTVILPIKTTKNNRSQKFRYKNIEVSVNPDTGNIIQVNPYTEKRRGQT